MPIGSLITTERSKTIASLQTRNDLQARPILACENGVKAELINAATILEYQQQYNRAAYYYRRASDSLENQDERRAASYRAAEMSFKQKQYGIAIKEMAGFIQKYQGDPRRLVLVQARWRIAESRKAMRTPRDYRGALQDVVSTYAKSGGQPGSMAAGVCCTGQLYTCERRQRRNSEKYAVRPGKPTTMQKYVSKVTEQIDSGSKEAKQRAEATKRSPDTGGPAGRLLHLFDRDASTRC